MLNLFCQILRRTVTWGGLYKDIDRGISRGCPLSPLPGACYLCELDRGKKVQLSASGPTLQRFVEQLTQLYEQRRHWGNKGADDVAPGFGASSVSGRKGFPKRNHHQTRHQQQRQGWWGGDAWGGCGIFVKPSPPNNVGGPERNPVCSAGGVGI